MTDQYLFGLIVVTVSIMVFLALAVLLIFNISQRRILHEVSLNQQKEIEFQQKIVENIIQTQEIERKRIARDLHDDIGSKLNIVNMNLNLLEEFKTQSETVSNTIDRMHDVLAETINTTRQISHQLLPPVLDKFGLPSAVESHVAQINRSSQMTVSYHSDSKIERLDKMYELHTFRIIQELISNTIKHARAKNIDITMKMDDRQLWLSYQDDGLDVISIDDLSGGLGFQNIISRIKLMEAIYSIKEQQTPGFQIELSIPLKKTKLNEVGKV